MLQNTEIQELNFGEELIVNDKQKWLHASILPDAGVNSVISSDLK